MKEKKSDISYKDTGYFSEMIMDYIDNSNDTAAFVNLSPDLDGLRAAINQRLEFPQSTRDILKNSLQKQYNGILLSQAEEKNIELLSSPNTFTICTAHQPALFTGTLYFIYKILHAIKLTEFLKNELTEYHFVPVFWMGSEDADLDELGMVYLRNEKLVWDTNQTGAVGRMSPQGLEKIIARIEGELGVLPFGPELIQKLKSSYLESEDIQTGTFRFVHELFKEYGLLVVIPDEADLKRIMLPVFKEDLFNHRPYSKINETLNSLSTKYKVQANPREINLFYIEKQLRERIEKQGDFYKVLRTDLQFTKEQIEQELDDHPERFSPNVFLRSLFQEMLLPNLAFIGGGGELAYWMELKNFFQFFKVPYPVLILRNSFTLIDNNTAEKIRKLPFQNADYFKSKNNLIEELLRQKGLNDYNLREEITNLIRIYDDLIVKTSSVDSSLKSHIEALKKHAISKITNLEKKLFRSLKKRITAETRWIDDIYEDLFPGGGLQERKESVLFFYAKYGSDLINNIYNASPTLESKFTILEL